MADLFLLSERQIRASPVAKLKSESHPFRATSLYSLGNTAQKFNDLVPLPKLTSSRKCSPPRPANLENMRATWMANPFAKPLKSATVCSPFRDATKLSSDTGSDVLSDHYALPLPSFSTKNQKLREIRGETRRVGRLATRCRFRPIPPVFECCS